ncbi:DUF742 domain-containing protein, partial [Methylobacterium frigidaeris]|uniref:DUF742 domain-containing protein n=1 Tax=Methylobacterium frigidaeris TaxID=2038277 RepID=UPI001EDEA04D
MTDDTTGARPEQGSQWSAGEAGPLVRPYAMTRGRTTGTGQHRLDLIAVVVVEPRADGPEDNRTLSPGDVDTVVL